MKKWRVGIVGVGRFGRLHLAVLRQLPNCSVEAIADIDGDLLRRVSEEHGIKRTYLDAGEMIEAKGLDAVDIVSDESTHGSLVARSLRSGRHVFVEKPLATSYQEAQEVERLRRSSGLQVMVGNISRFSGPYVALKRVAAQGKLGRLGMIRTKRHFSRAWFEHFGKRVHPVYESGIHDLDLILWYASSRCATVYAVEKNVSGYTYPDLFSATLTFEDGMVATLASAWMVPPGAPRNLVETLDLGGMIDADIELVGEKGMASFKLAHPGLNVWTDCDVQLPELTLWPTEHDRIGGAIRAELEHFLLQLERSEESPVAPLADSVEAMRLAEAIVQSAREKRVVDVRPGRGGRGRRGRREESA